MKKILIIALCAGLVALATGCSLLPQQQPEIEPQPIVLDVWQTAKGTTFTREINGYVDAEQLEAYFDYYGAYDKESAIYSLVYQQTLNHYKVDRVSDTMSDQSNQSIAIQIKDDALAVDLASFAPKVNATIQNYDNLRIVSDNKSTMTQAVLTGTAYRDYTRTQIENFNEQMVSLVNSADGFSLIIVENQPFLTATENLTMQENDSTSNTETLSHSQKPLVLAWDLYGNNIEQSIGAGVDAVIPKWLSLQDVEGNINNRYHADYAKHMRSQGAALWVLVNNGFDPDMTAQMLASYPARQTFIDSLMRYVDQYGIEGVNMDFENIYLKDSDLYVQLIAELYPQTLSRNIPLSVAVTVPDGSDNWSKVYDRPRLAKNCDYITLMAYDQHWENAPTSGPVAGYSWVQSNIEKMLKLVPRHKLVLGVPFYTRLWYESLSTEVPNRMYVRSKSVFMATPERLIAENNPIKVWDETNGQYYYAYYDDHVLIKFWYDDGAAVQKKVALAKDYQLKGVAFWSLGFEKDGIWNFISKGLGE